MSEPAMTNVTVPSSWSKMEYSKFPICAAVMLQPFTSASVMTYFLPIMASAPLAAGSGMAAGSDVASGTGSAVISGASPVRSYQSVTSLISRQSVPSSRSVAAASPSSMEMSSA